MRKANYAVPRVNPRFSFIAEAELTAVSNKARLIARIFKLSSRGCYVGTANPFPVNTELQLRIRYACSVCQMTGKVIYTHVGRGMGVLFAEIPPVHQVTLDGWLEELARKLAGGAMLAR